MVDRQAVDPARYALDVTLATNPRLRSFQADLRYPDQLKEPFKGKLKLRLIVLILLSSAGVDTVFHLASVVYVGLNPNPLLQQVNVDGVQHVIDACLVVLCCAVLCIAALIHCLAVGSQCARVGVHFLD